MQAYIIDATQDIDVLTCMGFSDPKTVRTANVRALYVPEKILLGYDTSQGRVLLSEKAPFDEAQDIVDGKKKGKITTINMDEPTYNKIMCMVPELRKIMPEASLKEEKYYDMVSPNSKLMRTVSSSLLDKAPKNPFYDTVKSLVDELYKLEPVKSAV